MSNINKFRCPKCNLNGNKLNPYETYNQNSMEIGIDDEHGFKRGSGELLYKCPNCNCIICITIEFDCKITDFKVDDVTDIIKEY